MPISWRSKANLSAFLDTSGAVNVVNIFHNLTFQGFDAERSACFRNLKIKCNPTILCFSSIYIYFIIYAIWFEQEVFAVEALGNGYFRLNAMYLSRSVIE